MPRNPKTETTTLYEATLLGEISNRLTKAATPRDCLQALSEYVLVKGANGGRLNWVYELPDDIVRAEILNVWGELQNTFQRKPVPRVQAGLTLDEPLLIADLENTPRIPPEALEEYADLGIRALVLIPLKADQKHVGGFEFYWPFPVTFTKEDHHAFKVLMQLSEPLLHSLLLAEREKKSQARNQQINAISQALSSQATNEAEIITTILDFARPYGAVGADLLYLSDDTPISKDSANGTTDLQWFNVMDRRLLADLNTIDEANKHAKPFFTENVRHDLNLAEANRSLLIEKNIEAMVMLPLYNAQGMQAILLVYWEATHSFTSHERLIYAAILPVLAAVVEGKRANKEAEESELRATALFQLAEFINAATSYQEIVDAVAWLQPNADGILLNMFENWNYVNATYFETIALASVPVAIRDTLEPRLPMMPIIAQIVEEKLWVSENIFKDERLDAFSLSILKRLPTKAHMVVPLKNGQTCWGVLVFNYNRPRIFSQREHQIALGIADLVNSAVARMRLQEESLIARQRAETLANLNAAFSKAVNETDILRAFVTYAQTLDAYRIEMAYAEHQYKESDPYAAYLIALWLEGDITDYYRTGKEPRHVKSNEYLLGDYWIPQADRILYIEDVNTDERIPPEKRVLLAERFKTEAAVIIPLNHSGQFQGLISLNWHAPHHFTANERYVFEQLFQTLPPIIATRRVYVAEQEERARAQTIASINAALLQASDEADILAAIAEYTGLQGAAGLIINYATNNETVTNLDFRPVARWMFKQPFPYRVINNEERFSVRQGQHHDVILEIRDISLQDPQKVAYIENVETDERLSADKRVEFIQYYAMRAEAVLGLYSGGRWQGNLIIMWYQPHVFSEHERSVYEQIAQNLSTVVATRRAYLAEQQAREDTSLLYTVSEAVNAAMTFADVIKAVAPVAREVDRVYLILWENLDYRQSTYFQMAAGIDREGNTPSSIGARFTEKDFPIAPHVLQHRQVVIENIADHPLVDPITQRGWENHNIRALLMVALVQDQRWYGTLSFEANEPRAFSERDQRLTLAVADLVLSAILRINAQHELTKAAYEQRLAYVAEQSSRAENELLYKVSRDINQATTVAEVMQAITRCFPLPLLIAIFALENYDQEGATYTETLISNDPTLPAGTRLPREVFDLLVPALAGGMVINDTTAPEIAHHPASTSAQRFGIRSMAFANLVQNQRVVGIFAIGCKVQRNFTDRELRLMAGVTDLTGAALERFRLRDETERARQRAHELAALEERTRLARELHDSVSQALYGIGLGAQTAHRHLDKNPAMVRESIEYVLTLAEAGLTEMRALIFELRPESLETEGLVVALAKQGASIQARHGIQVHLELSDEPDMPLPNKESLYRVMREALHNVVKHASATQITLRMQDLDDGLALEVVDNGIGFDSDKEFPGHLGLHSMRERIAQMNGEITIASKPGEGTRLSVRINDPSSLYT
ncbi:MAG: GAF domain-containing protein [Chloroflexi bacterium]|nr:GAF domain-containing protein [Chloroflexota bacterium]